jgi:apolipoprotein N-acyltransferase
MTAAGLPRAPRLPFLSLAVLALFSAGLLALCFYPLEHPRVAENGFAVLVWVALVPLFLALRLVRRPVQGAWLGLLFGLVFFFLLHRYLLMYGMLPTFLVALLQAFPLFLFGWVAAYVLRRSSGLASALALAGTWVLQEALRGNLGTLSLTFGQLGYTQHGFLPLLQAASVAGVLGLSFLIVLVNAAVAGVLRRPERTGSAWAALGLALALLAVTGGAGGWRLRQPLPVGQSLWVGVVQPNVQLHAPITPEDAEVCREVYPLYTDLLMSGLSLSVAEGEGFARPELVVWPETALPAALNLQPEFMSAAVMTAAMNRVSLLLGALEQEEDRVYYTAWLLGPDGGLQGTYRKQDLVMFGEYVPFRDSLPLLKRYPIRDFDFSPGHGRPLLRLKDIPFGALICFEAIFPGPAREEVQKGARFLAVLNSDAWAGPSPEVYVHSWTAPLRAVETGRWVVRAASIGRSAIISPRGKIVDQVKPLRSGVGHGEIAALTGLTPYVRYGDTPLLVVSGLLVLIGLGLWWRL